MVEVMTDRSPEMICFRCKRRPQDIPLYVDSLRIEGRKGMSSDDLVRRIEGTYNRATNRFACDECYVEIGMPSAPGRGWIAP
jgi:hypothetical protein